MFPRPFPSCMLNRYTSVFIFLQPKVSGLSDIIVSIWVCVSCLACLWWFAQWLNCKVCINLLNFLAARPGSLSLLQLDPRLQDSCSWSWGLYMTYFFIFLSWRYSGACLYFSQVGCLNYSWNASLWVKHWFGHCFPYQNDLSSFHLYFDKLTLRILFNYICMYMRVYYRGSYIPQTAIFCSFETANRFRFLLKTDTAPR